MDKDLMLKEALTDPDSFELVCPRCGAACSMSYALGLFIDPTKDFIDFFYCPSDRYCRMELRYSNRAPFRYRTLFRLLDLRIQIKFFRRGR